MNDSIKFYSLRFINYSDLASFSVNILQDMIMRKNLWFEFIGLIGVISSLVFVGVEIRQNTAAIKGATHQTVSEQINELTLTIASDERLSKIVSSMYSGSKGREDMTPEDQLSLDFLLLTGFRRVENIFLQYEDGILDKRAFERIGMDSYKTKFALQTWEMFKNGFDEKFILFFEELRDEPKTLIK